MTAARLLVCLFVLAVAALAARWLLDDGGPATTEATGATLVTPSAVEPEPDDAPPASIAAPVVVDPPAADERDAEAPVDVVPRVVRGAVSRAADATGIAGARVAVSVDDETVASTTTDAAGRYDLAFEHAPGEVPRLDVAWSARGRDHVLARDLVAPADADVVLDTGWTLRAEVVGGFGRPPARADVALVDRSSGAVLDRHDASDGLWLAQDLAPVSSDTALVVRADDAAIAVQPVAPPLVPTRRDVTVILEPAGTIAAAVHAGDGRPAAGAVLTIPDLRVQDRPLGTPFAATTDRAGRATLAHVPPLSAVVVGVWTDPRSGLERRFHDVVAVTAGTTTTWAHRLSPATRLAGRVTTISGVARPGVRVRVWPLEAPDVVPPSADLVTATDGAFAADGLEPGTFWIEVLDDGRFVAQREVELPPAGLDDVVIAYGGRVDHAVYAVDPAGAPLVGSDVTLLATEAGARPDLAQDWIGVTAGLPYDDPDGPLLESRVVSGVEYVGTQGFRQTRVEYSRPLEAPPPGLDGPSTRTLEPDVDVNLRAYFEPRLAPHARADETGRVAITLDANLGTIDVGGERLPSVPFGELSSTDDAGVVAVLDDWIHGAVDLWAVVSRAGWVTHAVRLDVATSTSPVATLERAPQLVVRVRDTFGSRRHEMHVEVTDPTTSARVRLDTEPLGPAAFVVFTDRAGDGRSLDVVVDVAGHERAVVSWTPGEPGSLTQRDLVVAPTD